MTPNPKESGPREIICDVPSDGRCKYSEDAAKFAVKQVFAILGVDVDVPKEVEEFREDLRIGSKIRKAADKGVMAVVAAVAVAVAIAAWVGITTKIASTLPHQ